MIHIAITTYNRPHLLDKLLSDLDREAQTHELDIVVHNDGSTEKYQQRTLKHAPVQYISYLSNHGRKNYYKLVNNIFTLAEHHSEWDYFIMLPDDVRLKEGFIKKCKARWERTTEHYDANAICLSIGHTHDRHLRSNWTGFEPKIRDKIVHTQWNDLCFICSRKFFEVLPKIEVSPHRWDKNKDLGSGVGQFISLYLHNNGFNMYHTFESLVEFSGAIAGEPSQMFRK